MEFRMPRLGASLDEATILRWLKKAGDAVREDEPLLEVSTEKVDTELSAPASGMLSAIYFPDGSRVPVGRVIATIRPADV